MRVSGVKSENVKVTVAFEDFIDESLQNLFPTHGDCQHWTHKNGHLIRYEDESYHGSPDYVEKERISDKNLVKLYDSLSTISSLLMEPSVRKYIKTRESSE